MDVTINKSIMDLGLWDDYYSKIEALLYLMFSVREEGGDEKFNGILYYCPKNGMVTSVSKLSDEWGWSRKKVSGFIKKIKGMGIVKESPRGVKAIILEIIGTVKINGSIYPLVNGAHNNDNLKSQESEQKISQTEIVFNDNNDSNLPSKEEEIVIEESIKSTEEEAGKTTEEVPEESTEDYVKKVVRYLNQMTGRQFKFSSEKTILVLGKLKEAKVSIEDCKERIDKFAEEYAKGEINAKGITPWKIFKYMPILVYDSTDGKGEEIQKRRAKAEEEEKEYIQKAIDIFNDVMGNDDGRGPTANNMDARELLPILKKKGKTLDQIRYVCEVKKEEWENNSDFCHFLRPATLFNLKKFERYCLQRKKKAGKMIPSYKEAAKKETYGVGDEDET